MKINITEHGQEKLQESVRNFSFNDLQKGIKLNWFKPLYARENGVEVEDKPEGLIYTYEKQAGKLHRLYFNQIRFKNVIAIKDTQANRKKVKEAQMEMTKQIKKLGADLRFSDLQKHYETLISLENEAIIKPNADNTFTVPDTIEVLALFPKFNKANFDDYSEDNKPRYNSLSYEAIKYKLSDSNEVEENEEGVFLGQLSRELVRSDVENKYDLVTELYDMAQPINEKCKEPNNLVYDVAFCFIKSE